VAGRDSAEEQKPEDAPLELAESLIKALSMPMNASLLCQVSNCVETKARAEGISFAAPGDQLRVQMQTHPPPDVRWEFWAASSGSPMSSPPSFFCAITEIPDPDAPDFKRPPI
jgi:hypothetical protein